MKNIVLKRMLILTAISIMCLVAGIAYGVANDDKMLMVMSIIICAVNLYKIWDLKRIETKNRYIMISGKCLESSYSFAGRYKIYKIQSGEKLFEVSLPKSVKLIKNVSYDLFFKEMNLDSVQNTEWLINKMLSENFIGYIKKE